ncbi:MAG TPA: hypothetical protein VHB73_01925, partial [Alphaproteobacteria bacterium]|nr:hypothetical protein [Alphaproteobacteria bacterium]
MPWIVIHIADPRLKYDKEASIRVLQTLTRAEEMGAFVENINAPSAVEAIRQYAEKQASRGAPVKRIFIGEVQPEKKKFLSFLRPSDPEKLRKVVSCPVESIAFDSFQRLKPSWMEWLHLREIHPREIVYAVLAVLLATLFIEVSSYLVPEAFGSFLHNRR